jgi:hypothetical protein
MSLKARRRGWRALSAIALSGYLCAIVWWKIENRATFAPFEIYGKDGI